MTLAEEVLQVALNAPDTLPARLQAAGALPPDVAVEVAQAGFTALDAGDLPRARAAFGAAMLMFSNNDDWPRAITCGVQHAEICKVLATTEDEHSSARDRAVGMRGLARRLRLATQAFNAGVVVADSAWFAGQSAREQRDHEAYGRWLLVTLDDCVDALTLIETDPTGGRARNLISLVGVAVREVQQTPWLDAEQSQADAALRKVALATESFVAPGTHSFTGGASSQTDLELVLAGLSYQWGSPDVARARLTHVAETAHAGGDLTTFIEAVSTLYAGERECYRLTDTLIAVTERFAGAVDDFRSSSRSRAGRLWMAQQLDELSGDMVTDEFTRLVGRDVERAYQAVERFRARTLLDEMTGHVRELEPSLRDRAAALGAAVLHLEAPPTLDDDVGDQIRLVSRLPIGGLTADPERLRTLATLEALHAESDAGFIGTEPIGSLDSVIGRLAPDEAIVTYHIPYDALDPAGTLLIMAITPRGPLTLHLPLHPGEGVGHFIGRIQVDGRQPIDASPLAELIVNTRMSILDNDGDADPRLAELYRILVAPLKEAGLAIRDFRTLFIVPHGILHAVPFAALRTPEGRCLVEDVATVVVPSVSVWEVLREREATAPRRFVGFANPSVTDYEPLPQAELEVAEVRSLLSQLEASVLVGDEASESALRRWSPGADVVHLATHGEFPEADAMNLHRVLLSATEEHDGHVNAEELRSLDLRSAQLVVLSICDGGVYRFGPGDEPYGLLSALLAAGARNVLGPLWAVEDTQTRLLMTTFYRRLLADGPAVALQHAVVDRLRAGAQIRDWAGFVLFGGGMWATA
ncbi:CHAT domain-containing protein [Knoellia subterranea]|uniref:CHAT domain-containing protein n=1 Tax=Knoellia subterranea KCTC 19937 TaxID=1385521 RepID=A0A0A0JFX5_9MICO|nr:CHAT domain-containing protein [Knoellia subterranea]KGN36355.1 hypothetical protein N803_05995 [Knoellia subterranea KCTC 19937]